MKHKSILIGFISAILLTTFFFYPVLSHLTRPLATDSDVGYGYFIMDNNLTKLAVGDLSHLFDTRMFYPLTNTLALGNGMLGQALMGLPVYLTTRSTVLTTNAVTVANYFLSYVFLYALAYMLTRSVSGSLIAAIIFTFNPYMMSRQHTELIVFEWIPLAFLAAEHLLTRVSWRWVLIGAGAILMLLFSSFYYFFFVTLLVPVYIALRLWTGQIPLKHFFKPAIAVGIGLTLIVGYLYLRPFILEKQTYNVYRPIEGISAYSAYLPDFLFTSQDNVLYGKLGTGPVARALWSRNVIVDPFEHAYEHRLFSGIVASLFFVAVIWFFVRKKYSPEERIVVLPFAILLVLAIILMFGPTIQIGPYSVPSLYRLVYAIPFADTLRAPTRFMVMAMFALSVLSAFVWRRIENRLKGYSWKYLIFLVVISFFCIEYRFNFGTFTDIPPEVKSLYATLDSRKDIRTIIEVPMTNGGRGGLFTNRSDIDDAPYLYFALFHHKNLVNGYGAYVPPSYQAIGIMVDTEFPTKEKLLKLKDMGVDAVVIHLDQYVYPSYGEVTVQGFARLGIPEIAHTGTIRVYDIH